MHIQVGIFVMMTINDTKLSLDQIGWTNNSKISIHEYFNNPCSLFMVQGNLSFTEIFYYVLW